MGCVKTYNVCKIIFRSMKYTMTLNKIKPSRKVEPLTNIKHLIFRTGFPRRAHKAWEHLRLTILWAFTACYRDSFYLLTHKAYFSSWLTQISSPICQLKKLLLFYFTFVNNFFMYGFCARDLFAGYNLGSIASSPCF
jgi:hypothetical protein